MESDAFLIVKYLIGKNYIFFSANIMLIMIAFILFLFTAYHLNLVRKNLTTSEETKRNRLSKAMTLVKKTLMAAVKARNVEYKPEEVKLTCDEIKKYKGLLFDSTEFDLDKLTDKEMFMFIKFTEYMKEGYDKNKYNKGFWKNLKNIINGV
jgi:hypothetical protein